MGILLQNQLNGKRRQEPGNEAQGQGCVNGIGKAHQHKHQDDNTKLLLMGTHIFLYLLANKYQQGIEGNAAQNAGVRQNGKESCVAVKVQTAVADDGAAEEGFQCITIKRQSAAEVIAVGTLACQERTDLSKTDRNVF